MKGLEALKNLRELLVYEMDDINFMDEVGVIEKELKALDIIKSHKLLNYVLKNPKCAKMYHLSEEKCELLKEVLK